MRGLFLKPEKKSHYLASGAGWLASKPWALGTRPQPPRPGRLVDTWFATRDAAFASSFPGPFDHLGRRVVAPEWMAPHRNGPRYAPRNGQPIVKNRISCPKSRRHLAPKLTHIIAITIVKFVHIFAISSSIFMHIFAIRQSMFALIFAIDYGIILQNNTLLEKRQ